MLAHREIGLGKVPENAAVMFVSCWWHDSRGHWGNGQTSFLLFKAGESLALEVSSWVCWGWQPTTRICPWLLCRPAPVLQQARSVSLALPFPFLILNTFSCTLWGFPAHLMFFSAILSFLKTRNSYLQFVWYNFLKNTYIFKLSRSGLCHSLSSVTMNKLTLIDLIFFICHLGT